MKIIRGDILTDLNPNRRTIILHGCNCFHTMGAGIAKYLKNKFPAVYDADLKTPRADKDKLGTYSRAIISPKLHILNCYTQFGYGGQHIVHARYSAIEKVCQQIIKDYSALWDIRTPQIGCGLGGADWEMVESIFEYYFVMYNLKVYYL